MRKHLADFLFFLMLFSAGANASFSWYNGTSYYSDPVAACTDAIASTGLKPINITVRISNGADYNIGYCNGTAKNGSDETVTLSGNSTIISEGKCDSGSVYNPTTGKCGSSEKEGDLCTDQSGATKDGSGSVLVPMIYSASSGGCVLLTNADNPASCKYLSNLPSNGSSGQKFQVEGTINDIGLGIAPPTFIQDGLACELSTLVTSSCKVKADGTSTCVVTAKLTGKVATAPTGADTASKQACVSAGGCSPIDLTPETTFTDTGCAEAGNCTQETKSDTTGSQNCITSGSLVCSSSKPKSTDTKTVTSTASTSHADDSVSSTVTAAKTTTSCSDVNTCTSSTSTTKSTTTTSKTGATSTSSTCTGTCKGDGTADDEPEKDKGSASASASCQTPPSCSGDVFQCALLNQQWQDTCSLKALPTADETASFNAKIQAQRDQLAANQSDLDDKVGSLVSTFESAGSSSSGGKCFEDKTFSVMSHSFVMPFSQTCPYLEWFRYAVIAVAYLISFRIITKDL